MLKAKKLKILHLKLLLNEKTLSSIKMEKFYFIPYRVGQGFMKFFADVSKRQKDLTVWTVCYYTDQFRISF